MPGITIFALFFVRSMLLHPLLLSTSVVIMSRSSQHRLQSSTSTRAAVEAVHQGTACPRSNPTHVQPPPHPLALFPGFVAYYGGRLSHVPTRSLQHYGPAEDKVVTRSRTSSLRRMCVCVCTRRGGEWVGKCVGWISRIAF